MTMIEFDEADVKLLLASAVSAALEVAGFAAIVVWILAGLAQGQNF